MAFIATSILINLGDSSMRHVFLSFAAAAALISGSAFAQTADFAVPGSVGPSKPLGLAPSKQADVTNIVPPGQLESGASAFTESQARARIQAVGFQQIAELTKDENGIWRAKARLGERSATVGLDHKGNIAAQ